MIVFTQVPMRELDEEEYNGFPDKLIFQTKEWIGFLQETQQVEPIVLRITDSSRLIGYFTGFLFKKFGIRIIGSPFDGWTTEYMGFNLCPDAPVDRTALIRPLWKYLRKTYHCLYCQITDRFFDEGILSCGFTVDKSRALVLDIAGTDDELLASFTKHARKHIRAFEKNPVTISAVEPTEEFAETFYRQLETVFSYQGLTPSYDLKRVKALLRHLGPRQEVLCTKVCENESGAWRSSAISFGFNGRSYTWATTNVRTGEDYRQSEGQRWFSIRYWRDHGCREMDMVGMRQYKLKFNPRLDPVYTVTLTPFKFLIRAKKTARKLYWKLNKRRSRKSGQQEAPAPAQS